MKNIEKTTKLQGKTITMKEFAESINSTNEPIIIMRNDKEPKVLPSNQPGVKVITPEEISKCVNSSSPSLAYGTKPNVPSANVISALRTTLGEDNYCLHISDSSYTGYTIFELNEFIKNFDDTNLRVWVEETFDCDDFSQVLQGNVNSFFQGIALGTIWYGPRDEKENWGHSVNIFFDYSTNKVYLLEPQQDSFYEFDKNKWKATMVII